MQRLILFVLLLAALAGGSMYYQGYDLSQLGLPTFKTSGTSADTPPPAARSGLTIRIATFNIQVFGKSKLEKLEVMDVLAQVIRQFDVVAIQEIRALDQSIVPRFVEMVNAEGRHYDYVLGPRLGRTSSKEQYAFLFDTARVEVDLSAVYTVDDPDDLLHREPLVAPFRVRGPSADEAFTFTLVNIHTDPDEVKDELNALDDVFRAVQNDGRGEDDVIMLGDLNADDLHFGQLSQISNITWAISGIPTNTRGTRQYDNLIYHALATTEFTGSAGVLELMGEFSLTMQQAIEVSDHLPVWAEFSVYEGGRPSRVATRPASSSAR